MTMTSPLLDLPGAVAGDGVDAPVAAHYGSFNKEQRALEQGDGFVDLSHRGVVRISGPDRLTWLHSLTTQHVEQLAPGHPTIALLLSPQGHVEHAMYLVDDGEAVTAHVEPGTAPALVEFLDRMRFMMRVEVADVTDEFAVCWRPVSPLVEERASSPLVEERAPASVSKPGEGFDGGFDKLNQPRAGKYDVLPRGELTKYAEAAGPAAGLWAFEALRIARGEPRLGIDTDARTIPNEVGWVGDGPFNGVHLDKGCYRGQETVARVHTLGRPPRRLTLLHLDGSVNQLPEAGAPLTYNDRQVGFVGSSARHHELGPIALGLLKRNVPVDAQLDIEGLPAAQEVLVDPEVGLHVRPKLR